MVWAVVWQRLASECGVSAVVAYDRVYYSDCDTPSGAIELVAAELSTAAVAWRKAGSWTVLRADAVGTVAKHLYTRRYVSGAYRITALNPATGATRFDLSGANRIHAVDATRIYATCGTVLCAYTRATSVREWTSSSPAPAGYSQGRRRRPERCSTRRPVRSSTQPRAPW